jgi:lipid-binding SYLF domain-containing protein
MPYLLPGSQPLLPPQHQSHPRSPPALAPASVCFCRSVNIVRHFSSVGTVKPERGIPQAVLAGCAGLAILSVFKVGAGWSCGLGTGLVVARRRDGTWSPPSSIFSISAGATLWAE